MRRPVKPFVTEYKGNARRPPSPSMKLEEDMPPRPIEASRFISVPQGEESYEAALRAADALFSGNGRGEPSRDGPADVDKDAAQGAQPATGRILRVLDEAPPQELVDLEVERAPKRRGRKPGSKNKPKTVQIAPAERPRPRLETSSPEAALTSAPATRENPHVSDVHVSAPHVSAPHVSTFHVASVDTVARPVAVATGARRGERYAWIRTQLKPGQEWKRHLPKVIW